MYIQLPAVICPYIIRPSASSLSKCSHVAQLGTKLEFAISTRGEYICVFITATGLPDWTIKVSSVSNRNKVFKIKS